VIQTDNVQLVLTNIHFGMENAQNVMMAAQPVKVVNLHVIQILAVKVLFFHKIL
jgi:hypothetical protein